MEGGATPVRKGRGWEWTKEQEDFLIKQIEDYGTAWRDIAQRYCKVGEIFEGRDQIKLKDKARNIKEKYIRYQYPLTVPLCTLCHSLFCVWFVWVGFVLFFSGCLWFVNGD